MKGSIEVWSSSLIGKYIHCPKFSHEGKLKFNLSFPLGFLVKTLKWLHKDVPYWNLNDNPSCSYPAYTC